ncbi:hypothetical protein Poly51_06280 [Rubripirellula tenax]|uniref:Uncharacterized protein n=1 Tax=Rubripirellula tenax TaxID=2528015 RepID=A0A5C6FID8_9BACT|nr:hypothetical protein Poly51_06280 [Rubripirellula tenax]
MFHLKTAASPTPVHRRVIRNYVYKADRQRAWAARAENIDGTSPRCPARAANNGGTPPAWARPCGILGIAVHSMSGHRRNAQAIKN